jgi:hypothetical protein
MLLAARDKRLTQATASCLSKHLSVVADATYTPTRRVGIQKEDATVAQCCSSSSINAAAAVAAVAAVVGVALAALTKLRDLAERFRPFK